jgi:hypothetical protein
MSQASSTLAEVHLRAAVHDVLATNRLGATDEMAVFRTHPYKRSSVLAGVFPTAPVLSSGGRGICRDAPFLLGEGAPRPALSLIARSGIAGER